MNVVAKRLTCLMSVATLEIRLKTCRKCRIVKSAGFFYQEAKGRGGGRAVCKDCEKPQKHTYYTETRDERHPVLIQRQQDYRRQNPVKVRARHKLYRQIHRSKIADQVRQRRYGLSPEAFMALKERQHGKCPGCLTFFTHVKPCIDHDHVTGKVRGLLCHHCNSSLGLLKDDSSTLRRLVLYLESYV